MAKGEIKGWVVTDQKNQIFQQTFSLSKQVSISKFCHPAPRTWQTFKDVGFKCVKAKLSVIGHLKATMKIKN